MLKAVTIASGLGVRQGASTSCILFVSYMDNLIRKLKASINDYVFLSTLHVMLLMDDTIILATPSDKLKVMPEFCN